MRINEGLKFKEGPSINTYLTILVHLVIYPLLSKNSGGYGDSYSTGQGWSAGSSSYGSYRSYNIAGTAEKVLSAIEKVYDAYNKSQ